MPFKIMISSKLRDEALLMLHGHGDVLATARDVSRIMEAAGIKGAIIGGVAVVLHGHVRTTVDVDVFVPDPIERLATALTANGFAFDPIQREFARDEVVIHLVRLAELGSAPTSLITIDDVRTVTLADLINMKLRSGTKNMLRAQDLADVIGLIRRHKLGGEFAGKIEKVLRPEFRKLAKAVAKESI